MDLLSIAALGVFASIGFSSLLSLLILSPARSVLQRSCPTGEGVQFWSRFTIVMLFLGPLVVTLIFGVPYSDAASRFSDSDLVLRAVTSALVGCFLTLGGIGLRIGTLRSVVATSAAPRKSDDTYLS